LKRGALIGWLLSNCGGSFVGDHFLHVSAFFFSSVELAGGESMQLEPVGHLSCPIFGLGRLLSFFFAQEA